MEWNHNHKRQQNFYNITYRKEVIYEIVEEILNVFAFISVVSGTLSSQRFHTQSVVRMHGDVRSPLHIRKSFSRFGEAVVVPERNCRVIHSLFLASSNVSLSSLAHE